MFGMCLPIRRVDGSSTFSEFGTLLKIRYVHHHCHTGTIILLAAIDIFHIFPTLFHLAGTFLRKFPRFQPRSHTHKPRRPQHSC